VGQPLTLNDTLGTGVSRAEFDAALDTLIANAEADSVIAMSDRIPSTDEVRLLFEYAYDGKAIDF